MRVACFHSTRGRLTIPAFVSQFARSRGYGFKQFAIKFFMQPADSDIETQHYRNALVRECLPQLFHAQANSDSALKSASDVSFPLFMVLERGTSLAECASCCLLPSYARARQLHAVLLYRDEGVQAAASPAQPVRCAAHLSEQAPAWSHQRLRCAGGAAHRAALRRCCTCWATSPRASTRCIERGSYIAI